MKLINDSFLVKHDKIKTDNFFYTAISTAMLTRNSGLTQRKQRLQGI